MALPEKTVYTEIEDDVATTNHVGDATSNVQVINYNHLLFLHSHTLGILLILNN